MRAYKGTDNICVGEGRLGVKGGGEEGIDNLAGKGEDL